MTYEEIIAGAVGYWPLQEASGTTAVDATGNGHDGALSGMSFDADSVAGPTAWLPLALQSGGGSDKVAIPDHVDLQGSGAISMWGWFDGSLNSTFGALAKNSSIEYSLGQYNSSAGGGVQNTVGWRSKGGGSNFFTMFARPTDRWYFAGATYNNTTCKVYIDGVHVKTRNSSNKMFASSAELRMFAHPGSSAGTGRLAGVGISATTLASADFATLFAGPQFTAKPWLYLPTAQVIN